MSGSKPVPAPGISAIRAHDDVVLDSMALEPIATGKLPEMDPKMGFFDTGATLVTDKPVAGVDSIDTAKGAELCWG